MYVYIHIYRGYQYTHAHTHASCKSNPKYMHLPARVAAFQTRYDRMVPSKVLGCAVEERDSNDVRNREGGEADIISGIACSAAGDFHYSFCTLVTCVGCEQWTVRLRVMLSKNGYFVARSVAPTLQHT